MALKFKEGVELTVTKTVNEILDRVEPIFNSFGVPCTITSGTEGEHHEHSKHYLGQALDFRISDIKPKDLDPLVESLKKVCSKDFFVLLERDHIHIQLPKTRLY